MALILAHDTETTGFSEVSSVVTEYASIAFDTELKMPVGFMSVLIDHGVPIPAKITELTGIDNALLAKYGVKKEMAVKRIMKFYSRFPNATHMMAHNEPFDRKMTKALLGGYEIPNIKRICTQRDFIHQIAEEKPPENNKLPTLSRYYKINHGFAHRAMTDTMACLGVALAAGLYEFLGEKEEEKVEIRIKLPYDPPNFDANNVRARSIGFYWSGDKSKNYHFSQIKKSRLDETLKKLEGHKDFKLLGVEPLEG